MHNFDSYSIDAYSEPHEDRFAAGGSSTVAVDWEIVIYAGTQEYISRTTDNPADAVYLGTLEKAFRIDRSVIGDHIGEEITVGLGQVTINNYEGDYDFLAKEHSPLGQPIKILHGSRKRPKSEWRTILNGFMVDHTPDRSSVVFTLRDAGHRLDVPASPNVYGGTGGVDGTADLAGKRKPLWLGWVLNVTPPLVIPTSLAYQLNDGQIHAVQKVYIRGVEQVFSANYATVALMNAAALSVGQYATSLATGWIRVAVAGGAEVGQVTCDFAGDKTGGVFVETTADIVRRVLNLATDLVDPDDLVVSTFTALNTLQPAPVGCGVPVGSEQTAATFVGSIMRNIGGWCGARRTGRFEVKRFSAPVNPPVARYTKEFIVDVGVIPLPSPLIPPPWRFLVGYARNYTVQDTDLAGSVTDARRAFLKEEVRYGVAEDNDIRLDFPPGHEIIEDGGLFRDQADATAEAVRHLALYGPGSTLYVVKLLEPWFVHELGQVIHVTFPRFDLADGKLLRIAKLTEDDIDGVEITAFG